MSGGGSQLLKEAASEGHAGHSHDAGGSRPLACSRRAQGARIAAAVARRCAQDSRERQERRERGRDRGLRDRRRVARE